MSAQPAKKSSSNKSAKAKGDAIPDVTAEATPTPATAAPGIPAVANDQAPASAPDAPSVNTPVTADYEWTIWGPVVAANEKKRPVVHRWIAHDPAATNFGFLALEKAHLHEPLTKRVGAADGFHADTLTGFAMIEGRHDSDRGFQLFTFSARVAPCER